MRWFGKPKEQIDIFSLVRVNDRMQVEIAGKTYLSRIEDIRENELHVAAPVERGGSPFMRSGQSISVNLFEGMGIRQFSGVVNRVEKTRVEMVVISDLKYLRTVQRREYARLCQKVPVRFRLEDGPDGRAPWFEGATQDLSGGGMQIVAETRGMDAIMKGDLLEIELYLPDQSPVKAVGQIVRASSPSQLSTSMVRFGVQLVEVNSGERRRIVQYVLKKQAEALASRREFTACPRVQVQYNGITDGVSTGLKTTSTKDMSVSGLRMVLVKGDTASVGQKLRLYITPTGLDTIEVEAEITWLEEGSDAGGDQVGVKFTSISRQAQQVISGFLADQNSNSSGDARAA